MQCNEVGQIFDKRATQVYSNAELKRMHIVSIFVLLITYRIKGVAGVRAKKMGNKFDRKFRIVP